MLRDEGRLQIKDAAAELGIAQSTAHRLLSMLVYRGFAVQDESRGYQPEPSMGVAPVRFSWARDLRDLAMPHLELFSSRLDETVNLVIRVGTKVRFLVSIEATSVRRVGDRQGTVLPARSASGGKALLAQLDEPALSRLYGSTGADIAGEYLDDAEYAALLAELELVRRNGYALNVEETEDGVAALGMALVAQPQLAIAAFSVSTPPSRFRRLFEGRPIELVHDTRLHIERELRARRHAMDQPSRTPSS